jgi:hypothetical protein
MNLFSKEFWMRHEAIALFLILSALFLAILGIAYWICTSYFPKDSLIIADSIVLILIIIFCNALIKELSESPGAKLAILLAWNVAHLFVFITLAIIYKFPISPGTITVSIVFGNTIFYAILKSL